MQLLYQTHSPYARKVLIMAHETGLVEKIEVIHHETSPTMRNEMVFKHNPLGKVPVLLVDDLVIYDSAVICEYLDRHHVMRRLIPANEINHLETKKLESLATGIADAGILARWEISRRPKDKRYQPFLDGQLAKLEAAYDFLESSIELSSNTPLLGEFALASSLLWVQYVKLPDFSSGRPKLSNWLHAMETRPSLQATSYSGKTHDVS